MTASEWVRFMADRIENEEVLLNILSGGSNNTGGLVQFAMDPVNLNADGKMQYPMSSREALSFDVGRAGLVYFHYATFGGLNDRKVQMRSADPLLPTKLETIFAERSMTKEVLIYIMRAEAIACDLPL